MATHPHYDASEHIALPSPNRNKIASNVGMYADYRMAATNELKKLTANAAAFAKQVAADRAKRKASTPPTRPLGN